VGDKIRTRVVNPGSGVAKQCLREAKSDMAYKYIHTVTHSLFGTSTRILLYYTYFDMVKSAQ